MAASWCIVQTILIVSVRICCVTLRRNVQMALMKTQNFVEVRFYTKISHRQSLTSNFCKLSFTQPPITSSSSCHFSPRQRNCEGIQKRYRPSVLPQHLCEHSRINILEWILTKLGTYLVLERIWNPTDFQGHMSKVKVTGSNCQARGYATLCVALVSFNSTAITHE